MQAVVVAIAKATWAWVRGKCEEAMREVLGAGRGVQAGEVETPAMAAEAGRETRRGAERRATRRATDAMGHKIARVYAYGYATHTKPQGFTSRPPFLTMRTNKVFLVSCVMYVVIRHSRVV